MITPLLFFLATSLAFANEACKGGEFVQDKFASDTSVGIVVGKKFKFSEKGAHTSVADGRVTFSFQFGKPGAVDAVFQAGTPVSFLLVDGKTLELAVAQDVLPKAVAGQYNVHTIWYVPLIVEPDDLAALAASPISAIRWTVGGEVKTEEMLPKFTKRWMAGFGCTASVIQ